MGGVAKVVTRRRARPNGRCMTSRCPPETTEVDLILRKRSPRFGKVGDGKDVPGRRHCVIRPLSSDESPMTRHARMMATGPARTGHSTLCALAHNRKWTDYIQANHQSELTDFSAIGSWRAIEMFVGADPCPRPTDQQYAGRFFDDDPGLFQAPRKGDSAGSTV